MGGIGRVQRCCCHDLVREILKRYYSGRLRRRRDGGRSCSPEDRRYRRRREHSYSSVFRCHRKHESPCTTCDSRCYYDSSCDSSYDYDSPNDRDSVFRWRDVSLVNRVFRRRSVSPLNRNVFRRRDVSPLNRRRNNLPDMHYSSRSRVSPCGPPRSFSRIASPKERWDSFSPHRNRLPASPKERRDQRSGVSPACPSRSHSRSASPNERSHSPRRRLNSGWDK